MLLPTSTDLDFKSTQDQELFRAVDASPKRWFYYCVVLFGVVVFNVRFLMARLPACCIDLPFTRQIVRLGGIERVLILLTIARDHPGPTATGDLLLKKGLRA